MAILGKSLNSFMVDEYEAQFFQTFDTPIGGKILLAELKAPDLNGRSMTDMEIKKRLASILADGILQNDMVEFTRMPDPMSFDEVYRARCYLAPSAEVKIIRQLYNK